MNQIRDAFGARLDRPADVLELVIALGASADTAPTSPAIA
jgi:hypothetical protein